MTGPMDRSPQVAGSDRTDADAIARAFAAEMPLRPDRTYWNTGTLAPTPRRTLAAMEQATRAWMGEGPGGSLDPRWPEARGGDAYLRMLGSVDLARDALARWLGAKPRNVALVGNTTDGLHAALLSIPFRPGDRVVTTDAEHEALTEALRRLALRLDLRVETAPFPARGAGAILAPPPFDSDRPLRLVALSHVSHRTGEVADLRRWLEPARAAGAWTLVDGAHAVGTLADPLGEAQPWADFYAFPAHKWLFGPVGTGGLWASDRALAETAPLVGGAGARRPDGTPYEGLEGAWRYEYGTRDWTRFVGLRVSLGLLEEVGGPHALAAHYQRLTTAFRTSLRGRADLRGEGPVLLVPCRDAERVALRLWREQRMLTKPTAEGLRMSLGPWLTPDDAAEGGAYLAAHL